MFKNRLFNKNFYKISAKSFSQGGSSAGQKFMYGLLGLSVGGIGLLCANNYRHSSSYTKALLSTQSSYNSKIVHQRTKDTFVYFSSGLVLTAGLTTFLARTSAVKYAMNPIASIGAIIPTIYCMYKIHSLPDSSSTKPLYFIGFNTCMAFSLVPLSTFIPLVVLRDAGLLTAGVFGALGVIASTSRDDAFIGWSGYIGAGMGGLFALSIASIFLNSPVIHNIWLYGGLALFTFATIHNMKEVQIRAKKEANFSPMNNSIGLYMDAINIFVRLAMILNNRKNK